MPVEGDAVVADPTPIVDGQPINDESGDYSAALEPSTAGYKPATYRAVIEVPLDATSVAIGFSGFGRPVDFVADLDPSFLEAFRQNWKN